MYRENNYGDSSNRTPPNVSGMLEGSRLRINIPTVTVTNDSYASGGDPDGGSEPPSDLQEQLEDDDEAYEYEAAADDFSHGPQLDGEEIFPF